jgi:CheY-like chemotaxis protein
MSKRILVMEDEKDNRQIIRDMLAPADYEITEAENGEQALARSVAWRSFGERSQLYLLAMDVDWSFGRRALRLSEFGTELTSRDVRVWSAVGS